jgi:hypothetical protein
METIIRDERDRAHESLEAYRAAIRKVREIVRGRLTDDEHESLTIACELGDKWHADRLRAAIAANPVRPR